MPADRSAHPMKGALTLLALVVALGAPLPLGAQASKKVPRIGYLFLLLVPLTEKPSPERQAFLQGLREFGYVEGQNIRIEYRSAAWNPGLLSGLAAELADLKVDVIVATGPQAARAARDATKTVPIVMTVAADPVESGLVASLGRPGGNITGLTFGVPELGGKRLQLLREAIPRVSPVAALGITLQLFEVRGADDFVSAFSAMSRRRPASLITIVDTLTSPYREIIADFALKNRLPTMASQEFADAGGLLSYGPSFPDIFRRAAAFVDKILKGARPADLPVEQPTKFELVINLKTAKALGLTVPQSLILRADRIIQ